MKTTFAWLALLPACGDAVPAEPTFKDNVQTILQANCVRCHGNPPTGGAPPTFRLDTYDFDKSGHRGAAGLAAFAYERACVQGDMPPVGPPLSERHCDIIAAWCGARCGADPSFEPVRGEHAANAAPTIQLLLPDGLGPIDETLELVAIVEDADGDAVDGSLYVPLAGGGRAPLTSALHGGVNHIRWDAITVPPGDYVLTADLSDNGEDDTTVELDTVSISHAGGNTAPSMFFFDPAPDRLIRPEEGPVALIRVSDPDGDDVTVTLEAVLGDTVAPLAGSITVPTPPATCDLQAMPPETCPAGFSCLSRQCIAQFPWDPDADGVEDGTSWHLRATADDGRRASVLESSAFIVSRVTSGVTRDQLTFLDEGRCTDCHARADVFGPDLRDCLALYTELPGPRTADLRGFVYRRVVLRRDMPPPSGKTLFEGASHTLSSAERALFGEWLLGGAQECLP